MAGTSPAMTTELSSLRANGSRECAPDDRLREAIHSAANEEWIASSLTLLAMTGEIRTRLRGHERCEPRSVPGHKLRPPENFFIIFVDAIFTTLFERLFTKLFDVTGANPSGCCVYRACHAD
jgi:hypothetical protein